MLFVPQKSALRAVGCAKLRLAFVRNIQTFDKIDSQVNILKNGKTVMTQGTGGRSSRSGYTVTVFGAPGLVGTALITKLAKQGTTVVAPYRDEHFKRHLKVTGDLGVVNFQEFDLRNVESIANSVANSDVVINLMGRNWETKNYSFYDVHVEGARRVAQAAKAAGVPRLIHVSSHTAQLDSNSKFHATKAAGESAVLDIYPDATIVRPAPVYGNQDKLLNTIAQKNVYLYSNEGHEVTYPTHLLDLASALETMVYNDSTAGQLYELHGPDALTFGEIHSMVKDAVKKDLAYTYVPKPLLKLWTEFTQRAAYWQGPMTPDEVERQFVSQVIDKSAKTYKDLGITPQRLQDHVLYLTRFHRANTYLHDSEETDARRKRQSDVANIVD